jgi:hypothetical protein
MALKVYGGSNSESLTRAILTRFQLPLTSQLILRDHDGNKHPFFSPLHIQPIHLDVRIGDDVPISDSLPSGSYTALIVRSTSRSGGASTVLSSSISMLRTSSTSGGKKDITLRLPATLLETCFNWLTLDDIGSFMCISHDHHMMTKSRLGTVTNLYVASITPCDLHLMQYPRRLLTLHFLASCDAPKAPPVTKTYDEDDDLTEIKNVDLRSQAVVRSYHHFQLVVSSLITNNHISLRDISVLNESILTARIVFSSIYRCTGLRTFYLPLRATEDVNNTDVLIPIVEHCHQLTTLQVRTCLLVVLPFCV